VGQLELTPLGFANAFTPDRNKILILQEEAVDVLIQTILDEDAEVEVKSYAINTLGHMGQNGSSTNSYCSFPPNE
jgi:hypothetical protein